MCYYTECMNFISQSKMNFCLAHVLLYMSYLYKHVMLNIKDTTLILTFKSIIFH